MSAERTTSSRIPKFYEQPLGERLARLVAEGVLSRDAAAHLARGGGLDAAIADKMSENVIATQGLPLSVALNFRVDGRDVLVPMAVEEPSVVAAASNAARLVRDTGGFVGEASASIMTSQIQLDRVRDAKEKSDAVLAAKAELLALGDAAIPSMVARGGGCRDLEVRVLDEAEGFVVLHVYVDVLDAMGANLVDSVAEAVAPRVAELTGGRIGLRILSNLPMRRTVKVRCEAGLDAIDPELADGIVRASRFAELDPFRAVTHNKGIMNGIDAVALALGQDWRSIEAGAHGWAARNGRYEPLAIWRRSERGLVGVLEMSLAVATVGGATRSHPGVRAAFELCGAKTARELALIMGAAGLASNLAALKALAGEGIQKGHMRLHHRLSRDERGATGDARPSDAAGGAKNGHANGAGNGHANGAGNGHANGAGNGRVSGVNGHEKTNGSVHGRVVGEGVS